MLWFGQKENSCQDDCKGGQIRGKNKDETTGCNNVDNHPKAKDSQSTKYRKEKI